MKKKSRKYFILAGCFLLAFVLWTLAICFIDVRAIGPHNSEVGFALLNGAFHSITGVHMTVYHITDWLGLVPIAVVLGFAGLGLAQWIRRRNFLNVDFSILALGGFYVLTMTLYILFEYIVINRRPVLIDGFLEASYPSSTTMLVLCVMLTAMIQLRCRIRNVILSNIILIALSAFMVFMVVGRLISGVHWLTDIIGGVLLSTGLVLLYQAVCKLH